MENPGEFATDYDVSFDAMAAHGWKVQTVNWRDTSIDWNSYDAVYICTPWDYTENTVLFMEVLETIDQSQAILINELPLVRWNLVKTYLRDLEERGAAIVPSIWFDDIDVDQIPTWFDRLDSDKLVIKPAVGVNADDAYILTNPVSAQLEATLLHAFDKRPFFVQPFVANIQVEGEYSLFFFGGDYSHAILKVPKAGDFRVQEEYGSDIHSVEPAPDLIATACRVLSLVEPEPVYARADFVRSDDDQYLLMELELIEPSLYLRTDARSADRFARAFDERFQVLAGK